MAAPPKPWERPGVNSQSIGNGLTDHMSGTIPGSSVGSALNTSVGVAPATGLPPPCPPRPGQQRSTLGSSYGGLGYGSSGLGYGGYNSMYSPGYSGMYGGGGGMYGSYGGYGGYGGYGMNRYGPNDEYNQNSFVRVAEESSRQAFQSIEGIVQAFGSVAMMLESTYSAVYNSFRAVIGVADHVTRVRNHFAQLLSAFALVRTLQWLYRRLLVLLRLRAGGMEEDAWAQVVGNELRGAAAAAGDPKKPRSNWPIMLFLGVIIGGPYLIWKFLSSITGNQDGAQWADGTDDHFVAVAEHDFESENEEEISFRRGQKINIAPKELQPRMRGWLLASVNGNKKGIIPANYVKILGKRRGKKHIVKAGLQADKTVAKDNNKPLSQVRDMGMAWPVKPSEQQENSNDLESGFLPAASTSSAQDIQNPGTSDSQDIWSSPGLEEEFNNVSKSSSSATGTGTALMDKTASDILSSSGDNQETGVKEMEGSW